MFVSHHTKELDNYSNTQVSCKFKKKFETNGYNIVIKNLSGQRIQNSSRNMIFVSADPIFKCAKYSVRIKNVLV